VVPMLRLTAVQGSFTAHVLRARLNSEGIDAELRGAVDSPYAVTVGDLARVEVFVPEDQMDDARLVMLAGEVDAAMAAPREWGGTRIRGRVVRWAALAALVAAALAPVVWYVRAFD